MREVFEETKIAGLTLKNRVFRSATHEGMGNEDGTPADELMSLYLKLAKGEVGTIITGLTAAQQSGRGSRNMRLFDSDEYIRHYTEINHKLQELDTPLILQLAHSGGLIDKEIKGLEPLGPSKKKHVLFSTLARELSDTEIKEIVTNFALAAERAKLAGFSGIQLHAAHGYLLSEFLSPGANRRTDRWGGNTDKRFRILQEIIEQSRQRVGDFPILTKFNAYDSQKNGMSLDEACRIAELFQQAGIDAIEVSCGTFDDGFNSVRVPQIPVEGLLHLLPQIRDMSKVKKAAVKMAGSTIVKKHEPLYNYNVDAAAQIKQHVDIPVIAVGGIRRLADIEEIISEEKADYVAMSRPFIIQPDLVNKFKHDDQQQAKCINCGYCLLGVSERQLKCYYGRVPKG